MAAKKKPYRVYNNIRVPNPPFGASHMVINCWGNTTATVQIKDVDTLIGSEGWVHFVQYNHKKKLIKEFDEEYYWNGRMFEVMKETYEER
tara:strand:+ start:78 stop:347 length:270 start_codon:yes stop_codon:yes gene_type:complete